MPTFLTVKEAARRTGKSPSSIRRLIYPIIQNDAHPDRSAVEPSPTDVQALRSKGETFAWRIRDDFLERVVPVDPGAGKGSPAPAAGPAHADLLSILRRELDVKNEQIAQQATTITALNERLREGNILMGALQQRLALTDGRDSAPAQPVKTKRSPGPEKGSTIASKPAKQKRGLFSRLFRG